MRRLALLAFTTLFAVTAFTDDLLDCLAPGVRVLMLQATGQTPPTFTSAVPTELSPLKVPREFTWVGTVERIQGRVDANTNLSQVTAAWRTTLGPDAARAAISAALAASGWEVRPIMGGITMMAFNSGSANPQSQPACRDGKPVNVTAYAMEGVTYALIGIQRGNTTNSICNQPQVMRPDPLASSGMDKIMPKLDMPVDPATGAVARNSGGGSSYGGGYATTTAQISVKDSVGNVAKHFAKQMTAQGWSNDATWSGTATAGSTWLKKLDANTVYQSTLSLTAVDERQFMATLRVMQVQ